VHSIDDHTLQSTHEKALTTPSNPREPNRLARAQGSLRIIAGRWRSRQVAVPAIEGLRPTPDRVRQTLFDWLQHFWAGQGQDLSGMRVLDAFAGSGALGFEAASRGASHVSFLEQHPLASQMLARQIASFQAANLQLISGHALRIMERLNRAAERFDLVLLDPPFASQLHLPAAQLAIPLLSEAGLLYVESDQSWAEHLSMANEPARELLAHGFMVLRHAKAGSVHYHLLQKNSA